MLALPRKILEDRRTVYLFIQDKRVEQWDHLNLSRLNGIQNMFIQHLEAYKHVSISKLQIQRYDLMKECFLAKKLVLKDKQYKIQ